MNIWSVWCWRWTQSRDPGEGAWRWQWHSWIFIAIILLLSHFCPLVLWISSFTYVSYSLFATQGTDTKKLEWVPRSDVAIPQKMCDEGFHLFSVWLVFRPSRSGGFQPNITGSLISEAHHFETSRLLKISACWSRSSLPGFSLGRIVDVSGACCQCFFKTWGCFKTRTERNPKEAGCVLPSICFKLHFFAGANNELRLGDDRPFFHSFPSWKPPNQWFMIWNSWCTAWPANVLFNLGLIDQM